MDNATRLRFLRSGVLHSREIQRPRTAQQPRNAPSVAGHDDTLFFAGRPVAQVSVRRSQEPGGDEEVTKEVLFLTTDHLGTTVLATGTGGSVVWGGGFEPFGADYTEAEEAGVFLRFPGQGDDGSWEMDGGGPYYNVHRWYLAGLGRYGRVDPLGLSGGMNVYVFALLNPLRFIDYFGLRAMYFDGCTLIFLNDEGGVVRRCSAGSGKKGTDDSDQKSSFEGPIPQGEYFINPKEFSGGVIKDLIRTDSWGRWRVPIHPKPETETFQRDGFFIHGDNRLDYQSAGCIDIGDCDTFAREWALQRPDEPIDLTVNYARGLVCH